MHSTRCSLIGALVASLLALPVLAQDHVYVTTPGAGAVVAVDSNSLQVAGNTVVGANPSQIIVDHQRARVYVANTGSDSISVIDRPSNAVLQTITVGDQPTAVAVTPNGETLYVGIAGGQVQVVDIASASVQTTINVGGSSGIAITPDGTRAYVSGGQIYVIDTKTNTVTQSISVGPDMSAQYVVIKPDGNKAYVTANALFGGSIAVLDLNTNTISKWMAGNGLTGYIAIAPDGSRVYVSDQAHWVDTGYAAGFMPGRTVSVFDTASDRYIGRIDLGADGNVWNLQNTGYGLAVSADRSVVYIAVPRISRLLVASTSTHQVLSSVPLNGLRNVATATGGVPYVPYLLTAADDSAITPVVGGIAIGNVRANDLLGGIPVTNSNTSLSVLDASPALSLDLATGAVLVADATPVGSYQMSYRLCEVTSPSNCDEANVSVTIRAQYAIDAVDDIATGTPGRAVLASVLGNDRLNGLAATRSNVRISLLSASSDSLNFDTNTGSVSISNSAAPGAHSLVYQICEIASPANCDSAAVIINVSLLPIDAVDDSGSISRLGGTAAANVLANDRFANAAANTTRVGLSQVSSSHNAIGLNTTSGAVTIAAGANPGSYSLTYRICELARADNCDEAQVNIIVTSYLIDAVNDSARASSKRASIALASMLTNDRFAGATANLTSVQLRQVSLVPANNMIRLDLTDGSVDILGRTSSGLYTLSYEICERANLSNCDIATVSVDLSGGG
jgi:YVTN family beta-propeller protein